jgi:hypothetical protein
MKAYMSKLNTSQNGIAPKSIEVSRDYDPCRQPSSMVEVAIVNHLIGLFINDIIHFLIMTNFHIP